jgi:hypothetical protein
MKQNAEISATQDYYEFVSSIECDGLRQSTVSYAQLGGIAFGLSVLTLSLRFENTGRYVWRRSRCVSAGCNSRTVRVATAYCRHDRNRVSVTVPDVTS